MLDNTHIYAGPICARYASDAGADVLHLLSPMHPNLPRIDSEVMPGKRSAWCDLTHPIMLDQFWKLVKDADVWVNSYLHLDRKGISPHLECVSCKRRVMLPRRILARRAKKFNISEENAASS